MTKESPLRQTDRSWMKYPDFKYRRKHIGNWVVELIGGTDRGAVILLWEKAKIGDSRKVNSLAWKIKHESMLGSFSRKYNVIFYKGSYYELISEVNFMYYSNALDEYKVIRSVKNVIDLAWRNR